jgi:predicted ribosomally synthesized peptide with nif11-like leader
MTSSVGKSTEKPAWINGGERRLTMSTIKEFKEKFVAEPEFAARFKDAKTAEEVVELARAEGFEIAAEDLRELSDEELEKVAGGRHVALPRYRP